MTAPRLGKTAAGTRLALVIAGMGAGGAERVLSVLANGWVRRGLEVSLFTLAPAEPPPFHPLDPVIDFRPLDLMAPSAGVLGAATANVARILTLRRAIVGARPRAVLSFGTETNVLTVMATRGLGLRVVVSERADPRHYPPSRPWRWLRRLAYPLATRVVVQTTAAAEAVGSHLRPVVIANPLPPLPAVPPRAPAPSPCILACGRLTAQKGFDLLLEAFARIAPHHPGWSLAILGEGEQREALARRARAPDLLGRVYLPGVVRDAAAAMRGADLFVLSSRYEGFPNVLVEAMACGLPVIAADCESGPRDIVVPEHNGLLVPPGDVDALAAAMDRVMTDPGLRHRLAAAAPGIAAGLAPSAILERWNAVLFPPARR